MGKIESIGSASGASGMSHLIEQANCSSKEKQPINEFPKGKCVKVRSILAATDYYVPEGNCGIENRPPCYPFTMPIAYSAVDLNGMNSALSKDAIVTKHEALRLYGTGISEEVVNIPKWWSRRDDVTG